MKVLLFNGSSKAKGCCFTALNILAKSLEKNDIETEIIQIGSNIKAGCKGCGFCYKNNKCVTDDILNTLIEKVKLADGYVFGSPVHYAAASGDIAAFLDRLFYICGESMAYKPGCAIVPCRSGGATAAFEQLNKYFSVTNMPVVSSNYWNMVHGNTPDEILQDKEGLQTMENLGKNMAWLLKCIEFSDKNGIKKPETEEKIMTNFIR